MHLLNLLRTQCGDVEDLLRLLQAHSSDAGGSCRLLTCPAPGPRCCLARCEGKHNTHTFSGEKKIQKYILHRTAAMAKRYYNLLDVSEYHDNVNLAHYSYNFLLFPINNSGQDVYQNCSVYLHWDTVHYSPCLILHTSTNTTCTSISSSNINSVILPCLYCDKHLLISFNL